MSISLAIQRLASVAAILVLMFVIVVLTWIIAEVTIEAVIRIFDKFERRKKIK